MKRVYYTVMASGILLRESSKIFVDVLKHIWQVESQIS